MSTETIQAPAKKRRTFIPSLASGLITAIAIPLCAYARDLFNLGYDVQVNIFELGPSGMGASFPYNTEFVINFLAMCVVLNVFFWLSLKLLLLKASGKEREKIVLEAIAVGCIIAATMGVVFHWGMDRANSFYTHQNGYDTSNVYAYLYFCDEWLGHGLQETSMLGFFAILVIAEHMAPRTRKMNWVDLLWIAAIAGVIAVTFGYAALKSETAMVMLVASVIMLGAEFTFVAIRRPKIAESPLLLATIVGNIAVIVQHVAFIFMFGLSPWYPWLRA
nr:hypothetical protein [Candidatus Sigynarchaeota archaeon]